MRWRQVRIFRNLERCIQLSLLDVPQAACLCFSYLCKGSSIHTRFDAKPELYALPLGTLDTDPGVRPGRHVFVGSKAPWFEITDDLPQYIENE